MRTYFPPEVCRHLTFTQGTEDEVAMLFGNALPVLPEEEALRGGAESLHVRLPPDLLGRTSDFLDHAYRLIEGYDEGAPLAYVESGASAENDFIATLCDVLARTMPQERRNGLVNLFWLAFAKYLAVLVNEFFTGRGRKIFLRYRVEIILAGALQAAQSRALRALTEAEPDKVRIQFGPAFRWQLIESIVSDQFPITETAIHKINLSVVLAGHNPRYPFSHRVFADVFHVLKTRLLRAVESREGGVLGALRTFLPLIPLEHLSEKKAQLKALFCRPFVDYLLTDIDAVAGALRSKPALVEAAGRLNGWTVLLDRYKALLDGVRRTEILEVLQHRVHLLTTEAAASEEDILFSQGRLFRFGETEQAVNNARAATILFADVRGFTRLSEKGFSEKELTESLYRIFDPIAEIVARFGGRIDKFIGDGVMITFGVPIPRREDPLMGLRTAVMMQRHLDGLRRQGKTDLKMGIALHTGRVFVAEFMGCQGQVHRTVIGRNVNLAGRLSSPKQPAAAAGESDEFRTMIHSLAESLGGPREAEGFKQFVSQRYLTRRMVSGVSVDSRGQLFNVGIVVSQDTVDEIRRVVASDAGGEEARHLSFADDVLGQRIVLEFVGDVVLEGVDKAVSVYSVLF